MRADERSARRGRIVIVRRKGWRRLTLAASAVVFPLAALAVPFQAATAATVPGPSGWNIVASPSSGEPDDIVLGSTCANAVECWTVGTTVTGLGTNPDAQFTPLIEQWNGATWSLAAVPANPAVHGGFFDVTCVSIADCWAVGTVLAGQGGQPTGTLAADWNGTAWSIVPTPNPAGASGALLQGVTCVTTSDCWAVGYTTTATGGNESTLLVEHWNGSAWSIESATPSGQAYDELVAVDCSGPADCWAVGSAGPNQEKSTFLPIFPGGQGDQGLIEHWNGTAWSIVPSYQAAAPDGSYLSSVTCVTGTDCWAAGSSTNSSGKAGTTLAERWNGSSWSVVATAPPAGAGGALLGDVTCLSATRCWAVGSGSVGAGESGTNGTGHHTGTGTGTGGGGGTGTGGGFMPKGFIESWNGSAWSIQPSPNVTVLSILDTVSCVKGASCWAAGSAVTSTKGTSPGLQSLIEQMVLPPASNQGVLLAAGDGGVFAFGTAQFYGSMGGKPLNKPVVGLAVAPNGGGYWEVASDGGVFSFGDAQFYGSMGGKPLNKPIVGAAPTLDGKGYWQVASDGGVFAFGDATFYGSMGGKPLNQPIVGIAPTADGKGYWLVAADGGIFAFGDAAFYGSMGGKPLDQPVVGMAPTPSGTGYWLVAADGGLFSFGNAGYLGSVPGQGITGQAPVVGLSPTPDGGGYWIAGAGGSVYAYGDAAYLGSIGPTRLVAPIVAVAAD